VGVWHVRGMEEERSI